MVQVNFNLSPTAMTQIGKALNQASVVLFGRIEVRMTEPVTIAVTKTLKISWIFLAPILQSPFLNVLRRVSGVMSGNGARLEMVGDGNDQVQLPTRVSARQPLPGISRQALRGVSQLANQLASNARVFPHLLHFH